MRPGKPVMIGISALRNTCLNSTLRSESPLARATSTYCLRISSTNVFLVRMVIVAKLPIA